MIADKDRSGYIGASDISMIFGSWETDSFKKFWLTKLGLAKNSFGNIYTMTGTEYEHKIIDALNLDGIKDNQIIVEHLKLRVNYDFETSDTIYEIKTYKQEKGFKVSKQYWRQAQAEMYANPKKLVIAAYALSENDYKNYFNPIIKDRISFHPVKRDDDFINNDMLPRLKYLSECIQKGVYPNGADFFKG